MTKLEQKKHKQAYRRFFKLVVLKGCYGTLRKHTLCAGNSSLAQAKDYDFVEEIQPRKEDPSYDQVVAYIRDDTNDYGGRPRWEGRSWFNQWYDRWVQDAQSKSRARFVLAQLQADEKREREITKDYEERLRRRLAEEADRPRRLAEFEARLEREEAERAERRRIAVILAGPKDRATPKGVMAFFQMASAAQAVTTYVENQNETDTGTEAEQN